jgi:transposase
MTKILEIPNTKYAQDGLVVFDYSELGSTDEWFHNVLLPTAEHYGFEVDEDELEQFLENSTFVSDEELDGVAGYFTYASALEFVSDLFCEYGYELDDTAPKVVVRKWIRESVE